MFWISQHTAHRNPLALLSIIAAYPFLAFSAFAADTEYRIPPIIDGDWHTEAVAFAKIHNTLGLVVQANRPDERSKLISVIDGFLETRKLEMNMKLAIAQKAVADMQNPSVAQAGKDSTKAPRQLTNAQDNARQALEAWIVATIHYRLISAYAGKLFPPPNSSMKATFTKAERDHDNELELSLLNAKPEYKVAISESWRNLMSEVAKQSLPQYDLSPEK